MAAVTSSFIYAPTEKVSNPETVQKLIVHTLEGKWDEVVEIYRDNPWPHKQPINSSQNTALHIAVDNGQKLTVALLVDIIIGHEEKEKELEEADEDVIIGHEEKEKELEEADEDVIIGHEKNKKKESHESALATKNVRGDTPLHLAASRGFANMCCCVVGENKERADLLKVRNKQGETPLFLAPLNWRKDAFLYLHHCCDYTVDDLTRDDGDSILLCAIRREYFDLVVIIIHCHKDLVSRVNKGITPLKQLATRPLAFKSSSNLGWLNKLLYHCILIEQVDVETYKKPPPESTLKIDLSDPEAKSYPKNYEPCFHFIGILPKIAALFGFCTNKEQQEETKETENYESESCYNFFMTLPKIAASLTGFFRKGQGSGDTENPKTQQKNIEKLGSFPPNYATFCEFLKSAYVLAAGLSGLGLLRVKRMKEKHVWSAQVLDLLMQDPSEAYMGDGTEPFRVGESNLDILRVGLRQKHKLPDQKNQGQEDDKESIEEKFDMNDSPLLIAAKNGILEMVDKILHHIPMVIHETTSKHKRNILLAAIESRQPLVVETLRNQPLWDNLILAVDTDENTALHLAARESRYRAWQIPGSAMQMLWDIKWYQYVRGLVPHHFHLRNNNRGQTPPEIFKENHETLVKDGSEWLKETSESCSVVAALIAGVAFATSNAVPGGNNEETGKPNYEGQPAFNVFAIASLVALCFSVTALIMFLAILTSRKLASDFQRDLPFKLLLGLSSLFISIASMLVSFCAAHFFVVKDKFNDILFPIYAATCLPVSFYAVAQFPLYVDLLRAIFTQVPQPSDKGSDL